MKTFFTFIFLACGYYAQAGNFFSSDSLSAKQKAARLAIVGGTTGVVYGTTIYELWHLWYTNQTESRFHFFNDNNEWLQMDKVGHGFSSWLEGYYGMHMLEWAGLPQRKAVIYGGTWGLVMQTPIEIMDGFSSKWGFSWGDMAGNAAGSAIIVGQELLWRDQVVGLRFSWMPSPYAKYKPSELGSNLAQQFIKDYNGQTYWVSTGIYRLFPKRNLPHWLNIAAGYGGDGMLRGTGRDQANDLTIPYFKRQRQFFLSFDLDMTKIHTKSKFVNFLLTTAAVLKCPSPTLMVNESGKVVFYWLYF